MVAVTPVVAPAGHLKRLCITSKSSEVAYIHAAGNQRIHSFASGNDGHLVVNYWDGFSWHWADQGVSADSTIVYTPPQSLMQVAIASRGKGIDPLHPATRAASYRYGCRTRSLLLQRSRAR